MVASSIVIKRKALPSNRGRHSRTYLANPGLSVGLVGAYAPILGPTGGTVRDVSFNRFNGGLLNITVSTAWNVVNNLRGSAYSIDFPGGSSNGVISVSNRTLTSLPCSIIALATYAGEVTGDARRTIVAQRDGAARDYQFRVNDSGKILSWLGTTGSVNSTLALTDDTVHCMGCSVDESGSCTFFLDGVTESPAGTVTLASNENLTIGGPTGTSGDVWQKEMWYIYIYDRVLLVEEMQSIFEDPFAPFRLKPLVLPLPDVAPVGNDGAAMYHHLQNMGAY